MKHPTLPGWAEWLSSFQMRNSDLTQEGSPKERPGPGSRHHEGLLRRPACGSPVPSLCLWPSVYFELSDLHIFASVLPWGHPLPHQDDSPGTEPED